MSKKQVVRLKPDGSIEFIDKPELAALKDEGTATKRRASHVEPANWLLRRLFHVLRRRFSEDGAVAAFTRWWPCLWRVNLTLSGGGILKGVYRNRSDAIDAEVRWLQENRLGSSPGSPTPTSGGT